MRILWLSHLAPYPPKGGVLQRSYHLLREAAVGNEVHLLAFYQTALLKIHFADLSTALQQCKEGLKFCASTRFVDIPVDSARTGTLGLALRSLFSRNPYTINWLASERFTGEVREFFAQRVVDLVHFDTISLVPYRDLMPAVPMTLDHHNVESHMMLRRASKEGNPAKRIYLSQEARRLQRYESRVCGDFASNLMCSELDGERLRTICLGARTDVVPNGVDLDYFRRAPGDAQPRRCAFVGRLNSYPNRAAVRFIVRELWPRLKAAIPGIEFDIVGSSPPREAVELAALDPAFRVTGFVDDVRPFLSAAAVYVCPIFDGGGTRLKILDAMAMETPLVATRLAMEGIDAMEGRDVLYAETPDEFTSAVTRLLAEPDLAKSLAKSARKLVVDGYSYKAIGREMRAVFERSVGEGTAGIHD